MVMERVLGLASLCALGAWLAALNEECRRFLGSLLSGETSVGLVALSRQTMHEMTTGSNPLISYMAAHLEMMGFALLAVVLFGLMIRT
jgi:hypothetical protein